MVVGEALDGAKAACEALGAMGSGDTATSTFMQCAWHLLSVFQEVVGRWALGGRLQSPKEYSDLQSEPPQGDCNS